MNNSGRMVILLKILRRQVSALRMAIFSVSNLRTFLLLCSIFVLIVPGSFQILAGTDACAKSKGKNTVTPSQQNYQLGLKKFNEHDLDGAIDAFLQAIYFERAGYYPKAYYWLGRCYAMKKEDGKAIEALRKSVDQNLDNATDAYCLLAEVYMRNDRLADADDAAKQAVVHSAGQDARARNVMGLLYLKKGEPQNAQIHFLDALGTRPWHYTDAWMNYANTKLLLHDFSAAVYQYKEMIAAKDRLKGINLEDIYLKMGFCVLQVGDEQGALDAWHTCLKYNDENADAHLQLGKLLDSEKHYSSAIKEYREFIRCSGEQQSPQTVAQVKDRITWLEQKLTPVEAEPQEAKPSPYMRKKEEAEQKAQIEAEKDAHKKDAYDPNNPHESGF
jgi:tetratricopeptide (TPR) repeat protein